MRVIDIIAVILLTFTISFIVIMRRYIAPRLERRRIRRHTEEALAENRRLDQMLEEMGANRPTRVGGPVRRERRK